MARNDKDGLKLWERQRKVHAITIVKYQQWQIDETAGFEIETRDNPCNPLKRALQLAKAIWGCCEK